MSSNTTPKNLAIWIDSSAALTIRHLNANSPLPSPQAAETLVEIAYSGTNPADVKHGRLLGIRDTVAGYDFSGTVVQAGPGSKHQPGTRIAGCTPSSMGRPAKFGTHQSHVIVPDALSFAVPPTVPLSHAACLAVSARTAADAIFNHLQYPLPPGEGEDIEERRRQLPALLVWGGASSLGFMAIQFARAAGVPLILTTASSANHAALTDLGASACFDYRDQHVVAQIREAAAAGGGGALTRVFDAVGSPQQRTAELAFECVDEAAVKVCSTIHPDALMPVATLELPFSFAPLGAGGRVLTVPPRLEGAERVRKALEWAVANYGVAFRIPTVEVVDRPVGALVGCLEEMAEKGANFRKVCLKHPFSEWRGGTEVGEDKHNGASLFLYITKLVKRPTSSHQTPPFTEAYLAAST